jgi:hypothetical protein
MGLTTLQMSETEWNGIFMIVGCSISAIFGIWTVYFIRRRGAKDQLIVFIIQKQIGLDDREEGFWRFYNVTKQEIYWEFIKLRSFFFWIDKKRFGKALDSFGKFEYESLKDETQANGKADKIVTGGICHIEMPSRILTTALEKLADSLR